jgi:hypothetical protein
MPTTAEEMAAMMRAYYSRNRVREHVHLFAPHRTDLSERCISCGECSAYIACNPDAPLRAVPGARLHNRWDDYA